MTPVITIFELSISAAVLPFTLLLIPIALYWGLCLVGMLDFEFLDVDFDMDAEGGEGGEAEGGSNFLGDSFHTALKAVNATDVPVMIVLSILVIMLWCCTMLGNLWFNKDGESGLAVAIALGGLVSAVLLTRLTTTPLKPVFRALKGSGTANRPVVGRVGKVRSRVLDTKGGQIEVEDAETPLLLSARLSEESESLVRGDEVIIYRYEQEKGICYVRSNKIT